MERLSNRPTAASRIGIGGLSPEQLKKAQDALALLAIAKINELIELINADASPLSIAALIRTPIVDPDNDERYKTLYDVLMDLIDGDLAGYLALTGLAADNLQDELVGIENDIKDLGTTLGAATDSADKLGSVFARLMWIYAQLAALEKNKVDKREGYGLSKNDLTDERASSIDSIGLPSDSPDSAGSVFARIAAILLKKWGSDNIADLSVTAAKLAGGSVSENKLEGDLKDKINGSYASVRYEPETGTLIFSDSNGKENRVDLPLELIVSDGYYAKAYSEYKSYTVGEYCIYGVSLYKCIKDTTGVFNVSSWKLIRETAESPLEMVLELASGAIIEIPADDVIKEVRIDPTLAKEGEAADAAAVGKSLKRFDEKLENAGSISIYDDGYGNVTITTAGLVAVSDDGHGNVSIT